MSQRTDQTFEACLAATKKIAREIAAVHSDDVDKNARFPVETVTALKQAGVMSAAVPKSLGGAGCGLFELGQICSTLSQACASSGMVLAMHYIQVGCIARHGMESAFFRNYLQELVTHQYTLASITSEVGTFGDTRSSICAIEIEGDRFTLNKEATTGSYCAHSDGILVTCRKDKDAAKSDQILVLVFPKDASLVQTTSWDTMGMRGTCSPGFSLKSTGSVEQIIPGPYAEGSAQTMVPYSHTLWSALWWGIAADAISKASGFVRGQARKNPGSVPPTALLLAEASMQAQNFRQQWVAVAQAFDETDKLPDGRSSLQDLGWALRFNNLKISSSEATPKIVHQALQIIGILAYKNDSPYALGRHYRDALSGSLMVSNERIIAKSANMLLVFKDDAA